MNQKRYRNEKVFYCLIGKPLIKVYHFLAQSPFLRYKKYSFYVKKYCILLFNYHLNIVHSTLAKVSNKNNFYIFNDYFAPNSQLKFPLEC